MMPPAFCCWRCALWEFQRLRRQWIRLAGRVSLAAKLTVSGRRTGEAHSRRSSGQLRQLFKLSATIAELLSRNPKLVQQCQLKVCQWRVFRIDDVTPALEPPGASAQKQDRQRAVRVPVAVANARAKQQDDMIEQRPIAIRSL